MNEQSLVLISLLSFLIGMLIIFLWIAIEDFFAPGFSPMGPWPSQFEQMIQDFLDKRAKYKDEYVGVVPVKNYRWSGEKELNIMTGRPTIVQGYKTIRYRQEWKSDEWKPYQEKIDLKNYEGSWKFINDGYPIEGIIE